MLDEILRYHDYDVSMIRDGKEVIQLCDKPPHDLMSLSPGDETLDGLHIATVLRGRVPFIVHSGLPDDSDKIQALFALGSVGKLTSGPGLHRQVADALKGTKSQDLHRTLDPPSRKKFCVISMFPDDSVDTEFGILRARAQGESWTQLRVSAESARLVVGFSYSFSLESNTG